MAQGRFLSKNIAIDRALHSVSLQADYLFMRMIPHLDVKGRMPGHPAQVKAIAVPMRDAIGTPEVSGALSELSGVGLVRWYEVDGEMYLEFPGFKKNQKGLREDREAESKIPGPKTQAAQEVTESLREDSGAGPEDSGLRLRVKSEVEGKVSSKPDGFSDATTSTEGGEADAEHGLRGNQGADESTGVVLSGNGATPDGKAKANELLAWWIDRQPVEPSDRDKGRQAAAAKRLCDSYEREAIAAAVHGIELIYPYSDGRPWDLMDLEKMFLRAATKALTDHPEVRQAKEKKRILDAIRSTQ